MGARMKSLDQSGRYFPLLAGLLTASILLIFAADNHFLLHTIAEFFSIIVACSIFVIVWNTRKFIENHFLKQIGIACLFIAVFDLLHTLSHKDMSPFKGELEFNQSIQFWLLARALEGLTFFTAALLAGRKINVTLLFSAYLILSGFLGFMVWPFEIFPEAYNPTSGITTFKRLTEYCICALLLYSIFALGKKPTLFEKDVQKWLILSITMTIFSEFAVTLYVSVFDPVNYIGHGLKILSFYFLYKAIVTTALEKPYGLLLRELKSSEQSYKRQKDFADGIIETAQTIILVLDKIGRIIKVNPFFENLTGYRADEIIGRNWFDTFLPHQDTLKVITRFTNALSNIQNQGNVNEIRCKDGRKLHIEWWEKALKDTDGNTIGLLSIGYDISKRLRREHERRSLIDRLQEALANIKTLQGLLPICAQCFKIRDEKGNWEQVEKYIQNHSKATFTHTLCPQCASQLYPEHYKDKRDRIR